MKKYNKILLLSIILIMLTMGAASATEINDNTDITDDTTITHNTTDTTILHDEEKSVTFTITPDTYTPGEGVTATISATFSGGMVASDYSAAQFKYRVDNPTIGASTGTYIFALESSKTEYTYDLNEITGINDGKIHTVYFGVRSSDASTYTQVKAELKINYPTTETTITLTPENGYKGKTETVTATLTNTDTTLVSEGKVEFTLAGSKYTGTVSAGTATIENVVMPSETTTVQATFTNGGYVVKQDVTITVTDAPSKADVTITADPANIIGFAGNTKTVTVTVTSEGNPVTGGTVTLGTENKAVTSGSATFDVALSESTSLSLSYTGNDAYNDATGSPVTITIKEPYTVYMKPNGDDTKDGDSEANAVKTLTKAVELAAGSKQIIALAGTYTKDNNLNGITLTDDLTITGQGEVIFDGTDAEDNAIFTVESGTLTIKNIQFKNFVTGTIPLGVIVNKNNLIIENCKFTSMSSTKNAPIYTATGKLTISSSEFDENKGKSASAFYVNSGTIEITESSFTNGATTGTTSNNYGAIYVYGDATGSIKKSIFKDNIASANGVGGAVTTGGTNADITIESCILIGNNWIQGDNNGVTQIKSNKGKITLNYNYFGVNDETTVKTYVAKGSNGQFTLNNWVVMTTNPEDPITEQTTGTELPITVSFTKSTTDGTTLTDIAAENQIPNELTPTFASTTSTITPASKKITDGSASATYTVVKGENANTVTITDGYTNTITLTFSGSEPQPVYVSKAKGNDETGDGTEEKPYATITKAITVAKTGAGKIIILDGTYTESTMTFDFDCEILAAEGVVFDGNSGTDNFIIINSGSSLFIENATFKNFGKVTTGVIKSNGDLELKNCAIMGNNVGNGGFIYAMAGSSTIIQNSVIKDNSMATYGIVYGNGANILTIRNSNFTNNTASATTSYGPVQFRNGVAKAIIEDCLFEKNTQGNGVIYVAKTTDLSVSKSIFVGNKIIGTGLYSAVISLGSNSKISVEYSIFAGNDGQKYIVYSGVSSNAGTADKNYWGTNTPTGKYSDGITVNDWFVMTATPSEVDGSTLDEGTSVSFDVDFTHLNTGTVDTGLPDVLTPTINGDDLTKGDGKFTGSYTIEQGSNTVTITDGYTNELTFTYTGQENANAKTTSLSVAQSIDSDDKVTLTVTVTSDDTVNEGTVTVYEGSTKLGEGSVSNGKATVEISDLSVGSHDLTVKYGPTSNFKSSSETETVVIKDTPVLTGSVEGTAGETKTVTVSVKDSKGNDIATGKIEYDGTQYDVTSGEATFQYTLPDTVGESTITVTYVADDTYKTATGDITVKVKGKDTVASLESVTGDDNKFTVVVKVTEKDDTSKPVTTGDVILTIGSDTTEHKATLTNDGTATFELEDLTGGANTLNIKYAGVTGYEESETINENVNVLKTVTISGIVEGYAGQTGTVTITVKDKNGNAVTSGTVSFEGNDYPVTTGTVTVENYVLPDTVGTTTNPVTYTGDTTTYADATGDVTIATAKSGQEAYDGVIYVSSATGNDLNNGAEDHPLRTIAKAIELAKDGSKEIIILEGTYKEHDLTIPEDLTITGQGEVIIDAEKQGRIFNVASGKSLTIENLILTHGSATEGGAIMLNGGTSKLTATDCVFTENTATTGYGAAVCARYSTFDLNDCLFANNTGKSVIGLEGTNSLNSGEGIVSTITKSIFEDNTISSALIYTSAASLNANYNIFDESEIGAKPIVAMYSSPNSYDLEYNYWGGNSPSLDDLAKVNNAPATVSKYLLKTYPDLVDLNEGDTFNVDFNHVSDGSTLSDTFVKDGYTPYFEDEKVNITQTTKDGVAKAQYGVKAPVPPTPPVNPTVNNVTVSVDGISGNPGENVTVPVNLTGSNGKTVNDGTVSIKIGDETYTASVSNGVANVEVTLPDTPGETTATITYTNGSYTSVETATVTINNVTPIDNGTNNTNNTNTTPVDVPTPTIISLVFNDGETQSLDGKLVDANNNPINGEVDLTLTRLSNGASKTYTLTASNGEFSLPVNLGAGDYSAQASFAGNDKYLPNKTGNIYLAITDTPSNVILDDKDEVTGVYGDDNKFDGVLTDKEGNALAGYHVALNITRLSSGASKVYYVTTDYQGNYVLPINLAPGVYTIRTSIDDKNFTGASLSSLVITSNETEEDNRTITVINAPKTTINYGAGESFTAKLMDSLGYAIAGQHVDVKLSNSHNQSKTYSVVSDYTGSFSLPINLARGVYTAECSYAGTETYQSSSATSTITVQ